MKVALAAFAVIPGTCLAQIHVDSRLHMDYHYEFGASGNLSNGGDRFERTTTSAQDSHQWHFSDLISGSGFSASVQMIASAEHQLVGEHPVLPWASIEGQLLVGSKVGGTGIAKVEAGFPGVESSVRFDVVVPTSYRFKGQIAFDPGEFGPNQTLAILWDNGVFWEPVWSTANLPGSMGQFDVEGLLAPGQYRAYGRVVGRAEGSESHFASFQADLWMQPVPEPASGTTIAALCLLLLRFRSKPAKRTETGPLR